MGKSKNNSKYNWSTTAEEIAKDYDLTGKNAIVTGGYSGIGVETVKVLAAQGAKVIIVGRDIAKANSTAEELKKVTGKDHIFGMECDLSSFESIRKFVDQYNELREPLHYLINNAGVMVCPYGKTKDGFEMQFGTNFLGHFLLTNLLVPRLIEGAPSRVVVVASSAHWCGGILWDDYNFEKKTYYAWAAYGQSKSGNIMMANEFNRRYKDQGVIANSLHPGNIKTGLQRHGFGIQSFAEVMCTIPGIVRAARKGSTKEKTIGQGAATSIYCALSEEVAEGGKYCDDCHVAESASWTQNPEDDKRLWEVAEKFTGLNETRNL